MSKKVVVLPGQIVSSIKYQKDFKEGEVIDLSFASDEDVAALVASGAVKEIQENKKDVKNG